MSKWSIIWAGVKGFLKPGSSMFEEIVRLALDTLNNLLSGKETAEKVSKAYDVAKRVLSVLVKYQNWCPAKWMPYFNVTITAVSAVVEAFADSMITEDEVKSVTERFQIAYASWMAD